MSTAAVPEVSHQLLDVGGVRLHVATAGEGPLVVLLHGFPDFWYSWRHQIPALVAAGYRVAAPDLRGYGGSDKPPRVDDYRGEALIGDVVGLIEALGERRAAVVGHDWGGAVAWLVAIARPQVVQRLAILNAPHPAGFSAALRDPGQLLRSSYMLGFQVPWLPERVLQARRAEAVVRALRRTSVRPQAWTDDDLERYRATFSQPGALFGPLAYYRSMGRRMARGLWRDDNAGRGDATVRAPTLVVWGARDPVLPPALADPGDRVPDRRVEYVDDAGHFVHVEAPDRVNGLLVDFLGAAGS